MVGKITKTAHDTWNVPSGIKDFYFRNLISDQGLLMFIIKHGVIPDIRSLVLSKSDISAKPAGGRYKPANLKKHFFEVDLAAPNKGKITKDYLKKKKVGKREETIWNVLRVPPSLKADNVVEILDQDGTVLVNNGTGVELKHPQNIIGSIKELSVKLQTPQGIPSNAILATGDITIHFKFNIASLKQGKKSILKHLLLTDLKKLFSMEQALTLKISTKMNKQLIKKLRPPLKERAAFFDGQAQEYAIKVLAYELVQWNPMSQQCQFKINFQGDNLNAVEAGNAKARLNKSDSTNFFAAVTKELTQNESMWRYTLEHWHGEDAFKEGSTTNIPLTLKVQPWHLHQFDVENQLKLQRGDKTAIVEWMTRNRKFAIDHPKAWTVTKVEQKLKAAKKAGRTEDGFFTTIGSLLVAVMAVYTKGLTPYSKNSIAGEFLTIEQLNSLYVAVQRSVPITLFKNFDALDEAKKGLLEQKDPTTDEGGFGIRQGLQSLFSYYDPSFDKENLCSILDVPVTGRIMRQFFTEVFEHNTVNNFRSMVKAILDGLVTSAVKQSFFKASDKYGWFYDIYGVDQRILSMGSIVPYSSIRREMGDALESSPRFVKSAGIISYEDFYDFLYGKKDLNFGNNIWYFTLGSRSNSVGKVLKNLATTATPNDLLKLQIFKIDFSTFSASNVKEIMKYRIANTAANKNSPIKFSTIDSKEAEESRRQEAVSAGLKTLIRRFYKISLTVQDVVNFLPFVHRLYLPPSAFGFDTPQEDLYGLSGIYVITDVSYVIKDPKTINVNLSATWDYTEYQLLIDNAGLQKYKAEIAEAAADKAAAQKAEIEARAAQKAADQKASKSYASRQARKFGAKVKRPNF